MPRRRNRVEEKMNVYSIFNSISGEVGNIPQGSFTTFVRLGGCNLRCSYCDTKKTWTGEGGSSMSVEEVVKKVDNIRCNHVLITGGEPMLQDDTKPLINALLKKGYKVSVETNGSIALPNWSIVNWIVDYKLPGSEMGTYMNDDLFVDLPPTAWIKFVVGSVSDFDFMRRKKQQLLRRRQCSINMAVSPVLGKVRPYELINALQLHYEYDIVFSLQIHKFIWPEGESEK
jgi:7-carboxy-7-deazaguanine synthase